MRDWIRTREAAAGAGSSDLGKKRIETDELRRKTSENASLPGGV
jgi:hypothetical protein